MPTGHNPPGGRPNPDTQRNITKALNLNPDAIIINLPSNDAAFGFSVTEQLANYDSILVLSKRQNVPAWISTTQPRNLSESGRLNLMAMRDSTFARYGHKAIDFWTDLARPDGRINPAYNSGDGVHLNDAGHRILFNRVVEANISDSIVTDIHFSDHIPLEIALYNNYPNPFNSSTVIKYSILTRGKVNLKVYNILGNEVITLVNSFQSSGEYQITFNANDFPSGLYFYQIRFEGNYHFSDSGKMLLIK
jgi:hypothetical protein